MECGGTGSGILMLMGFSLHERKEDPKRETLNAIYFYLGIGVVIYHVLI
jgi:hypothetical protein